MSAYTDALIASQFEFTVDCTTATTRSRIVPTPTPGDRDEDVPTRAELEAER